MRRGAKRCLVPLRTVAGLLTACIALGACGSSAPSKTGARDSTCRGKLGGGVSYITAWFHASSSVGAEWQTLVRQVAEFNHSQRAVHVRLITLPEGDYSREVATAAASGNLPDVLDFDGPNLYNYAWAGDLKPIDSCLSQRQRADLLPSIRQQGTYAGRTWGVGTFDSGLGLYVRRSILRRAGISIPTDASQAWTVAQFTQILARLRAIGYRQPLDLQINYDTKAPEWNTYGFAPAVWSAGGDLIDRSGYHRVNGFLNGAPATRALTVIQGWAKAGYVNPNRNGMAFEEGKTPISWVGHWLFAAYTKAFPGDVQIVPLPRFGPHDATDMGSWQWGITANATNGDAAWRFISFLLRPASGRADDPRQRCDPRYLQRDPPITAVRRRRPRASLRRAARERGGETAPADCRLPRVDRGVRQRLPGDRGRPKTREADARCRRSLGDRRLDRP